MDEPAISVIGRRLRALRQKHGWRLTDVAGKTGISIGTLSKLENGKTDLNFTSVNKLAEGLRIAVTDLTSAAETPEGDRTMTLGGGGVVFETPDIDYEILCGELSNQNQSFLRATIKAKKPDPSLPWHSHPGREFLYVLSGTLELHTERNEPVRLTTGDSILFDSSVGHHYVSRGRRPAHILISMSLRGYSNVMDSFRAPVTRQSRQDRSRRT